LKNFLREETVKSYDKSFFIEFLLNVFSNNPSLAILIIILLYKSILIKVLKVPFGLTKFSLLRGTLVLSFFSSPSTSPE